MRRRRGGAVVLPVDQDHRHDDQFDKMKLTTPPTLIPPFQSTQTARRRRPSSKSCARLFSPVYTRSGWGRRARGNIPAPGVRPGLPYAEHPGEAPIEQLVPRDAGSAFGPAAEDVGGDLVGEVGPFLLLAAEHRR